MALLRKVIEGDVETAVLGETIVFDEEDRFDGGHALGSVADLNGDGTMEVVMNVAYFEGFAVAIWEFVSDDLGLVRVLETGCGV